MNEKQKFPLYRVVMMSISAVLVALILYVYSDRPTESSFPILGTATDFTLTDLQGQPVSLTNTAGKVRLVYFFFASCPDVCPVTTQMLANVQQKLKTAAVFGTKVMFLQVTIDPLRDTVPALNAYTSRFGVDATGWRFLRGEEAEVKRIGETFGVAIAKDAKTDAFLHANTVLLLDADQNIRKRYNGDQLDDTLIATDVLRILEE